jgi:hypothetical protein
MSALLIVSCGNTDLQVAATVEGRDLRLGFARSGMRAAHEALVARPDRYRIDEGAAHWDEDDNLEVSYDSSSGCFSVRHGKQELERLLPPLLLLPAKLAGIGEALEASDRPLPSPTAAIVFNTRRDERKDEPISGGLILSKWLADIFELKWTGEEGAIGVGRSGWVDYLTGTMVYEGAEGENINKEAMERIDRALRSLEGFEAIYFAPAGGITAMREQIRTAARFRFPRAKFFDFPNTERPGTTLVEKPNSAILPSDSFRARQQARELVSNGNFFGAAVVASGLAGQDDEQDWTQPLDLAAQYFDGRLAIVAGTPAYMATLCDKRAPRCLLSAMRAEAALRSGQIRDAVLATFSFRDAALVDYISRLPFVEEMSEIRQRIVAKSSVPTNLLQNPSDGKAWQRCLAKAGETRAKRPRYRYRTGAEYDKYWFEEIGRTAGSLKELTTRLESGDPSPKDVRNILTHNTLPAKEMNKIQKDFITENIWKERDGGCFLQNDVIASIFEGLGVQRPHLLYKNLVDGLVLAMEDHKMK